MTRMSGKTRMTRITRMTRMILNDSKDSDN